MIIVAFVLMTAVIGLAAYFLQGQLELPGRETGSRGDAAQEDSQEEKPAEKGNIFRPALSLRFCIPIHIIPGAVFFGQNREPV